MRDRLGAAAYYTLNVLLSPVTLLGYGIWVGKALRAGRGSGVSGTAQGPLFARFFQHELGLRDDAPARRLMMHLPNVPALGLHLFTIKFGIDSTPPSRERLAELLDACGLSLVEQRTLGRETEGHRAWGGFAIASVR